MRHGVLFLLTLLLFGVRAASAEVRIVYPAGGSGCQIVRFPHWTLPKDAQEHYHYWIGHFDGSSVYVFRHAEDTPSTLLLVGVEEEWLYKANTLRSRNQYWLNLRGKARIRSAKESEWNSAGPLIGIFSGPLGSALPFGDRPYYEYNGRKYSKPGKVWGSGDNVVLSSSATWLRLESVTPLHETSDGYRDRALIYADVFHTPTGKKVLAVPGTLADFDANQSAVNTGYFIENRFFVTPIGDNRKRMLICDLSLLVPDP